MKLRETRTIHLSIRVVSRDFLARDVALTQATAAGMRLARTELANRGFSIWNSSVDVVNEGNVDVDAVPEVARHV